MRVCEVTPPLSRNVCVDSRAVESSALHQQIVDQLIERVIRGSLRPGDTLDTISLTTFDEHISQATVSRAYGILKKRGVIVTVVGAVLPLPIHSESATQRA